MQVAHTCRLKAKFQGSFQDVVLSPYICIFRFLQSRLSHQIQSQGIHSHLLTHRTPPPPQIHWALSVHTLSAPSYRDPGRHSLVLPCPPRHTCHTCADCHVHNSPALSSDRTHTSKPEDPREGGELRLPGLREKSAMLLFPV